MGEIATDRTDLTDLEIASLTCTGYVMFFCLHRAVARKGRLSILTYGNGPISCC